MIVKCFDNGCLILVINILSILRVDQLNKHLWGKKQKAALYETKAPLEIEAVDFFLDRENIINSK